MNDKLLPIGSVVLLKEAKKRLMIIGYYPTIISEEGNTTTYDYSGCLFPEGIIDSESGKTVYTCTICGREKEQATGIIIVISGGSAECRGKE